MKSNSDRLCDNLTLFFCYEYFLILGTVLICEFIFQFNVKRELLDFCVNVKKFWELSVTREKSQYFYANVFCKGV